MFSSIAMILLLVVPGLDQRFGWSLVPLVIVVLADAAILTGYALFALTLRENRFASRIVEVDLEQVVIGSGPYAMVRHPMYLAMTVMFVLTPLALGLWPGLVPSIVFPLTLIGTHPERGTTLAPRTGRLRGVLPDNPLSSHSPHLVAQPAAPTTLRTTPFARPSSDQT